MIRVLSLQGSGAFCEDTFLCTENCWAVFDGATPLVHTLANDSPGRRAAQLVRDCFAVSRAPLAALAANANETLRAQMKRHGVSLEALEARWGTTALVVRSVEERIEWFSVGDSFGALRLLDGSIVRMGDGVDHDVQLKQQLRSMGGLHARPAMHEAFLTLRREGNRSYGVFNGDEGTPNFVHEGSVEKAQVAALLLCTDGAMLPMEEPDGDGIQPVLDAWCEGTSLDAWSEVVRSRERSDPSGTKFPRTKMHDDLTMLSVHLR